MYAFEKLYIYIYFFFFVIKLTRFFYERAVKYK